MCSIGYVKKYGISIIDTWTCAPIIAFLSFHEILSTRPIYGEAEKISGTRQKSQAGKSDK